MWSCRERCDLAGPLWWLWDGRRHPWHGTVCTRYVIRRKRYWQVSVWHLSLQPPPQSSSLSSSSGCLKSDLVGITLSLFLILLLCRLELTLAGGFMDSTQTSAQLSRKILGWSVVNPFLQRWNDWTLTQQCSVHSAGILNICRYLQERRLWHSSGHSMYNR